MGTQDRFADLHIHTYYSDGTSSPQEVVDDALRCGLACIAITDHDIVEGVQPTMDAAQGQDLEVIAGVELSSQIDGRDVHMLGYMIDHRDREFVEQLETIQRGRMERMKQMIKKLGALGITGIDLEEVCALTKSGAVGRPHLAAKLVEKGEVRTMRAAFDKYLAEGAPAFVEKYKLSATEAIEFIKRGKGVAVLAHPMVTNVDEWIPKLVKAGLDGLEVYYPNTTKTVVRFYEGIAQKHGLLLTGGSDAHGEIKKNTYISKVKIPYDLVERLKQRALNR